MDIRNILLPKPTLSKEEINAGLRWLTWEGTVSLGFNSITNSGILVSFALILGADSFHIGILAAIPFITQILQIPAIWLVEKTHRRKAITVLNWLPAQLLWFPIAFIPIMIHVPSSKAVSLLLILMTTRGLLNAISNAAWNGWIRDLVPQSILGRFFSRRMAFATLTGVVFSLGTAFFIDYWRTIMPEENIKIGYTYVLFLGAALLGLASPLFMSLMPEPLMQPIPGPQLSIRQRLSAPIRNTNFRHLLQFLLFWSFASNLAIPFFAIHMLQRLGLPVSWVIGLSILSQTFNLLFLRVWGPFVDRFGSKPVLSVGVSLYTLVIFGWIFTTMPERYFLTLPLLIILHIFAGIAGAAVSFTVGTIGLKLAPDGEATSYLATASLATNIGSGLGPIIGGLLANFFSGRQLDLVVTWINPTSSIQFSTLSIIGRDFLFGIAFLLCLSTIGILAIIKEKGEVSREVLLDSLMSPIREFLRPMSSVPKISLLGNFPFGIIKQIPVPGLDVALGVTVYQIAEIAKVTASTAMTGRKFASKLAQNLEKSLAVVLNDRKKTEIYGVEVTRHMVRGVVHALSKTSPDWDKVTAEIMKSIVISTGQLGVKPEDAIVGASQGIVQGAIEVKADVTIAVAKAIEAVKKVSRQIKLPEELAMIKAAEGALSTAEVNGPVAVAEVAEAIPETILLSIAPKIN